MGKTKMNKEERTKIIIEIMLCISSDVISKELLLGCDEEDLIALHFIYTSEISRSKCGNTIV